jgi:hypothetical protein
MDALDFLQCDPDFSPPRVIAAYDELPLWSAMFGLLLLDDVPEEHGVPSGTSANSDDVKANR